MSTTTTTALSSSTVSSSVVPKLAFCFLTKNGLLFPKLWNNFFKEATPDRVSIWIHCYDKESESGSRTSQLGSHTLHYITRRSTKWGDFSLVRVQQALSEAACKDPYVSKVLFIADTAIPVQSFSSLYTTVIEKFPHHGFLDYRKPNKNQAKRYDLVHQRIPDAGGWEMGWNPIVWYTASQWCVLTRFHVSLLSLHWSFIENLFDGTVVPDEHVYPVMFQAWNLLETTFINRNLTLIHWWDTPEEWEEYYTERSYGIDCPLQNTNEPNHKQQRTNRIYDAMEACQDSPRTYHRDEINRTELQKFVQKDFMFLRKVCCLPDDLQDQTW